MCIRDSGRFIQVAKELASEISLDQYGVFYDSELTRMADVHFFLLVMATIEREGYFPRDKEVEVCVAEFNEEYENSHKVKSVVLKAMSHVQDFKLELDSIWFRKSCFFTMVVELCFASEVPSDIVERLVNFDTEVLQSKDKKDTDFGMYYHAMYSGTNDRKTRVIRSDLFKKYILA